MGPRKYGLQGRLILSESGFLLLTVPNALVRGLYDALGEPGIELPSSRSFGRLNAHVTVMRPSEVKQIGADKISERGKSFSYRLGRTRSVVPSGWKGMSRVYLIDVISPELRQFRRSYGLTPLPNDQRLHITFATRRKGVLNANDTGKAANSRGEQADVPEHYGEAHCTRSRDGAGGNRRGQRLHSEKDAGGYVPAKVVAAGDETVVASSLPRDRAAGAHQQRRAGSPGHDRQAGQGGGQTGYLHSGLFAKMVCASEAASRRKEGLASKEKDPSYSPEHSEECCPGCGARLKRGDDGTCNRCNKPWPKKAIARSANNVSGKSLIHYKAAASLKMEITQAEADTNTNPTPGEIEAGNYKKGKIRLHGLEISIENPKGSTRSGTSSDGKKWESTMKHTYGYVKGTVGADGDHVDVFLGEQPDCELVFVVNQVDPKTRAFDERKVMLGFMTEDEARQGYLANYEKGWKGLGEIIATTLPQFKEDLANGDQSKPYRLAKSKQRKAAGATRPATAAGVSGLVADEGSMSQPAEQAIQVLRSPRYFDLQKMAIFLPGLFRRHGGAASGDDSGPGRQQRKLLPGKLPLGLAKSAASEQAEQRVLGASRAATGSGGLGAGDGVECQYNPGPFTSRMVCRKNANDTGGQEIQSKIANVAKLREAKKESDKGNYPKKHHVLYGLMKEDPESFEVDDTEKRQHGITHTPSGFRLHTDPAQIPTGVKRKKSAASSQFKSHTTYDPICPHCDEVMYEKHFVPDQEAGGHMWRHRGECYDKGAFEIKWPDQEKRDEETQGFLARLKEAEVSDEEFWDSPPNKEGRKCPGCSRLFKECEPLADVEMCEACERYGKPKKAEHIPTVGVDFDGTIAKLVEPFEKDISTLKPRPNARKWMKKFQDMGARVIIFTVRGDEQGIKDWCHEHDIPADYVNENPDQPPDSSGKVMCDVYWDDRGVSAQGALDKSGPDVVKRLEKAGEAPPIWARTLNTQLAAPTWTPGIGVIGNLGVNYRQAKERGLQMARDEQSAEDIRAQLEPGFGYRRLQAILSGHYKPIVAGPIDQALFQ